MRNIERSGVDIRVALASHARQSRASKPLRASDPVQALPDPATANGLRSFVKRGLRRLAKAVYRLGRPVGRPLAFRLRAYFTAPLHAEFARVHEHLEQERQHHRIQQKKLEQSLGGQIEKLNRDLQRLRARAGPASNPAIGQSILPGVQGNAKLSPSDESNRTEVLVRTLGGTIVCLGSDLRLLTTTLTAQGLPAAVCRTIADLLAAGGSVSDAGLPESRAWLNDLASKRHVPVGADYLDLLRIEAGNALVSESALGDVRQALEAQPGLGLVWRSSLDGLASGFFARLAAERRGLFALIEHDTGAIRMIEEQELEAQVQGQHQGQGQVLLFAGPNSALWKRARQ